MGLKVIKIYVTEKGVNWFLSIDIHEIKINCIIIELIQ
jgi:hypothetical protein